MVVSSWPYMSETACRRSVLFHFILCASVGVDIPMYVSLTLIDDYSLVTYSFHKFSNAFLFVAYSLTIYDWSSVLCDIREIHQMPLFFRKNTLVLINIFMLVMSAVNFVYMYTCNNLDDYLTSPLYITQIFVQIVAALLLTGMMLSAGIRLSIRIQGASKELSSSSGVTKDGASRTLMMKPPNRGLRSAVNRLNAVMCICFFCITIQVN